MTITRRNILKGSVLAAAATALPTALARGTPAHARDVSYSGGNPNIKPLPPGLPGRDYQPVIIPNGAALPFKIVGGIKVFHLIAEEVEHEFMPGLKATCWGYNGRVNSTCIEAVEGERIRIYLTNKLPEPTTGHWHGLFLPNGMDGVGGLTQRAIQPGETFKYEFTLRQHGTYMFHAHHDEMTQQAMGLIGLFIIHPRTTEKRVSRDFALLLSEWKIEAGATRPDPMAMNDFNLLTINGRCYPGTDPLVCQRGDTVRIRIGNLSAMDHHPIHMHGHYFKVTATDGGPIPESAQWPEASVLVAAGQTRNVEFVAEAPGDWAMHCHMSHHVMNQMGHGLPNMIGVNTAGLDAQIQKLLPSYMSMGQAGMADMGDMSMPAPDNSVATVVPQGPFDPITMGGMFTIIKVRDKLDGYADPGWYQHPEGTMAELANATELARDGVMIG
jgi:FtsP/CotA-like multicopper oxidase with cupredoxin domain